MDEKVTAEKLVTKTLELAVKYNMTSDPAWRLLNFSNKLGDISKILFENTNHGRKLPFYWLNLPASQYLSIRAELGKAILNLIWFGGLVNVDPLHAASEELQKLREKLEVLYPDNKEEKDVRDDVSDTADSDPRAG